jgi:hypothetical protein
MRIRNPAEKCSSYLGSIHGRAGNAGGHIRWMVVTAAAAARGRRSARWPAASAGWTPARHAARRSPGTAVSPAQGGTPIFS